MWASTVRSLTTSRLAMRGVGESLGHELEHVRVRARTAAPTGPWSIGETRSGDDHGVESGTAGGDALGGGEELVDFEDAVFEEVAEPAERDEVDGVGGLDVLGEHEHADVGMLLLDRARGAGAFVGERGRHADVDDGEVGAFAFDGGQELRRRRRGWRPPRGRRLGTGGRGLRAAAPGLRRSRRAWELRDECRAVAAVAVDA